MKQGNTFTGKQLQFFSLYAPPSLHPLIPPPPPTYPLPLPPPTLSLYHPLSYLSTSSLHPLPPPPPHHPPPFSSTALLPSTTLPLSPLLPSYPPPPSHLPQHFKLAKLLLPLSELILHNALSCRQCWHWYTGTIPAHPRGCSLSTQHWTGHVHFGDQRPKS